jgi:23S rRNA (guanosine2251-2'-O)-methyltransferase
VRELLIARRRRVKKLLVDRDREKPDEEVLELAREAGVRREFVEGARIAREAHIETHQGVVALAGPVPAVSLDGLLTTPQVFLVAVDGVTDPGNLGALLRSAEGAGVSGIVLPRHRAVHVTPTVAKAAAGAIEHLDIALVSGLPSALQTLTQRRIWVVGLDDAADRSLFDLGDLAAEPIALVLGAEGAGLSRLARERCDLVVSIPMLGRLSSLNVSAAAALACYEVARHRA